MITCSWCGRTFSGRESEAACEGCVLITKGCGRVRCPHCGYENQRPLKDALPGLKERWKELFHGPRR